MYPNIGDPISRPTAKNASMIPVFLEVSASSCTCESYGFPPESTGNPRFRASTIKGTAKKIDISEH